MSCPVLVSMHSNVAKAVHKGVAVFTQEAEAHGSV